MQRRFALLFLLLALISAALAQDSYEALLARAKTGDVTLDYAQLRYAFSASPASHTYSDHDDVQAGYKALHAKDFDKALKISDQILKQKYVSLEGHFIGYVAASELGNKDDAQSRRDILKHLIDGILHSGDGKTPATAYIVISTDEEYFLLHHVWGAGLPKLQSLVADKGHSYDKLVFTGDDGNE